MGGWFSRQRNSAPEGQPAQRQDLPADLTPIQALLWSLDHDDSNTLRATMATGSFSANLQLFRSASKLADPAAAGLRPNALVNDYNWELSSETSIAPYSILHVAISKMAPECVRLLLDMGADPALPAGATKQVPLLFACAMASSVSMAVIGASAKCSRALDIVEMLAIRSPESVQLLKVSPVLRTALLMGGPPVMARTFLHGVTIRDVERVMESWKSDSPGSPCSLVARAARYSSVEIAASLLGHGADPAAVDIAGDPLLLIAWKSQGNRYAHAPRPCSWVHTLVQAGVDVNAMNSCGTSAVHIASSLSDTSMLKALFQYPVSCSAAPVFVTGVTQADAAAAHRSYYDSSSSNQLVNAWDAFSKALLLKPVSEQFAAWRLAPSDQHINTTRPDGLTGPCVGNPSFMSGLCGRTNVNPADLLPFGEAQPARAMYAATALDFSLMNLCMACKPSLVGVYRKFDGEAGGAAWFQNLPLTVGHTLQCLIILLKYGDVLPHVPSREDVMDDAQMVNWVRNDKVERASPPPVASELHCLLASVLYRPHIRAHVEKHTGSTFAFARRKHAVTAWHVFQEEYLRS
jgi:ankyrin repeat protein